MLLPRDGLCVSTQVGCAVGCVFCMTGREGLLRQVGSAEIVAQVALARRRIGVVHQDTQFLDHLPVAENILLPLTVAGRLGEGQGHLRELLAEMLEMLNYRVVQSGDAAAALALIDAGQQADLLITDVGLPGGMNGRQLAEAARLRRPELKVLFITGYAEDAPTRNGMLEPAMEVLTKPFSLDTFAQRVAAMLKAGA